MWTVIYVVDLIYNLEFRTFDINKRLKPNVYLIIYDRIRQQNKLPEGPFANKQILAYKGPKKGYKIVGENWKAPLEGGS